MTVAWSQSLTKRQQKQASVPWTYFVQWTPNYTYKTRVATGRYLPRNHDLKGQRPLGALGNVLFWYVLLFDVFLLIHFAKPCQTVSHGSQDIDNVGITLL